MSEGGHKKGENRKRDKGIKQARGGEKERSVMEKKGGGEVKREK